jgi:hypothetical protein
VDISHGFVILIFLIGLIGDSYALWIKAPNKARLTRVAEPIANPFPIAAVVFPAESKTSVQDLIFSPNSAISAIPPALSEIGPNPSMASPILKVESIPIAAKAIPNNPKRDIEISMVTDIIITGITVDI